MGRLVKILMQRTRKSETKKHPELIIMLKEPRRVIIATRTRNHTNDVLELNPCDQLSLLWEYNKIRHSHNLSVQKDINLPAQLSMAARKFEEIVP